MPHRYVVGKLSLHDARGMPHSTRPESIDNEGKIALEPHDTGIGMAATTSTAI